MRHLTYHFDLRRLYLLNSGIFLVGAAVASSAQTMAAVILGRIVMGIGGAFVQQMQVTTHADPRPGLQKLIQKWIAICFMSQFAHQKLKPLKRQHGFLP